MNDKKYSVLMSVYEKEKPEYFVQSIQSMLNQTIRPDEIVIVKDGALTKRLDEIIEKYEYEYANLFKIISLKRNGGLGKALNIGLKYCRNDLVARMDTDDISLSRRCELQLSEFEKNDSLCACGSQILEFMGKPDNIVSSRRVPVSYAEIKTFARRRSPFNHPTVMYKKSIVQEIGGYSEYGRKEDLDLFVRMVGKGYYVKNIDEVLLLYRTSKENQMRRFTWLNCSEYISIMYKFYKKKYIGILDFMYVLAGQLLLYLMPSKVSIWLTKKYLRNGYVEKG